jgi:hypothetical protein
MPPRDVKNPIEPVRNVIDRFKLRQLLRCLGISVGEAASYTGISSASFSRTLTRRGEFTAVSVALQRLSLLADLIDGVVEMEARRIRWVRQRLPKHATQMQARILIYLRDEDLPPWFELPFASAHRVAMARIAGVRGYRASLVAFDRGAYFDWLGPEGDNEEARMNWAIQAGLRRRFCFKIGGRYASSDVTSQMPTKRRFGGQFQSHQ